MADSGKKRRDTQDELNKYNNAFSAGLEKIIEQKGKIGKLTEEESLADAIIIEKRKGRKD